MLVIRSDAEECRGTYLYRLLIPGILCGRARTLGQVADPDPVCWYADHQYVPMNSKHIPQCELTPSRNYTGGDAQVFQTHMYKVRQVHDQHDTHKTTKEQYHQDINISTRRV